MPNPRILFYISGHGYGHARRSAQVIAAIQDRYPGSVVYVRTKAPHRVFSGVLRSSQVAPCRIDAGAAEFSPLEIDPEGTLRKLERILLERDQLIREEAAAVEQVRPDLIVSDIPALAGPIAQAHGLPCVGISNFSWDWIVEPYIAQFCQYSSLLGALRDDYATFDAILRLPLGGMSDVFSRVIDVPLVANPARRERDVVLKSLGIAATDRRRRVLFGLRGSIPTQLLGEVARSADDLLLICPTNEPGEVPPGVISAPIGDADGLDFSDVLGVCDVVVGKMGYGLIAECIVSGVALLWPRRTGFREDEIVERDGPAVLRMRELPLEDFHGRSMGGTHPGRRGVARAANGHAV